MNADQLAEIQRRLAGAPPGPWTAEESGSGYQLLGPHGTYEKTDGNGKSELMHKGKPVTPYILALQGGREFVVNAREDVEALLAEVAQLRQTLDSYEDGPGPGLRAPSGE